MQKALISISVFCCVTSWPISLPVIAPCVKPRCWCPSAKNILLWLGALQITGKESGNEGLHPIQTSCFCADLFWLFGNFFK
jgi:hypothetical protein